MDDKKDVITLHASSTVYPVVRRFLTTYKLDKNCEETRERFERLCRYLNKSMETEAPKLSYATLCLQKDKRYVGFLWRNYGNYLDGVIFLVIYSYLMFFFLGFFRFKAKDFLILYEFIAFVCFLKIIFPIFLFTIEIF